MLNLKKGQQLRIAVCFEERQLKKYVGDKNCIYRTIIRIRDNQKLQFSKTLEEKPEIINDFFEIEDITLNGSKVKQEKILPYKEDKGIEIICKYIGPTQKGAEIKIRAKTIRDKKVNFYTAYIFDPTFNPQIMFNYPAENIIDVYTAEYYTSKKECEIEPHDSIKFVSVKLKDEWVFPTSGVVFIWTVK